MILRALLTVALAAALVSMPYGVAPAQDTTRDTTTRTGLQFDGAKLAPIVLTYQATVDTAHVGERVVDVVRTTYSGTPAWLLVETHPAGPGGPFADSLIVDSATLTPLHWSGAYGYARVGVDFADDSARGTVASPAGTRAVAMPVPPGTVANAAMIEVALRTLPLATGWHDSTTVLVNGIGTTRLFGAEVEVVGQEKLTVPAGAFDCWIVTLTTDVGQATYWVAKREGFVVKTSQLLPDNAGLLTYTLTRVGGT